MFRPSISSGGSITINQDHYFSSEQDREDYFNLHPTEKVEGTYIVVIDELQKLINDVWVDQSTVIRGPQGEQGVDGDDGHSITITVDPDAPATYAVGDIWVDTDETLSNLSDDSVLWNGVARPSIGGQPGKALVVNATSNAFVLSPIATLENTASKTEADLTLYVYEDAVGSADGSSKSNGFTSLQAAIDAIPDVAENVTIIVSKGSTNYLGDTTNIQKASVKSLTIQGEYYYNASCDSNAVAGKIVDADGVFTGLEVGDRVVCTKYSGTVGSSSIEDYFYATITEVGSGYVQTSEDTKVPTTGWKYLINQTVFDGNNSANALCSLDRLTFYLIGISCVNYATTVFYGDKYTALASLNCIFNACKSVFYGDLSRSYFSYCHFTNSKSYGYFLSYSGIFAKVTNSVIYGDTSGIVNASGDCIVTYSGIFGTSKAIWNKSPTSITELTDCYIASSCNNGAYGYNITLISCNNLATTPVTNLVSGGSIEVANHSEMHNLIINGGFAVNQRAYVSAATLAAGAYGHDRWKAGASGGNYSFTQGVNGTTITIASGKSLIQVIEDKNIQGGNYVLSWTGTATARYGKDTATPSGSYTSSPITITGQTAGTVMSVEFGPGTLGTVKLESGTVATPFVSLGYAEELRKCQWYYYQLTGYPVLLNKSTSSTTVKVYIYYHRMRTLPTVTFPGVRGTDWMLLIDGGENTTGTTTTPTVYEDYVGLSWTSGTFVSGGKATVSFATPLSFDAEL